MSTIDEILYNGDLLNDENYRLIKERVDDLVMRIEIKQAKELQARLAGRVRELNLKSDSSWKLSYDRLLAVLKFINLPLARDSEMIDFIENELFLVLDYPDELLDFLKFFKRKIGNLLITEQDEFKNKIVYALSRNSQVITGSFEHNGAIVTGTIDNWVRDYIQFLTDKADRKMAKAEYFFHSRAFGKLPMEEQARVRKIVDLLDLCNLSSLTVEGFIGAKIVRDTDGTDYGLVDGEIFEIGEGGTIGELETEREAAEETQAEVREEEPKPSVAALSSEEMLARSWQEFLAGSAWQGFQEALDMVRAQAGNDIHKVRNHFYHAVNEKKAEEALGALGVLAEKKWLRQAFGEDERFIKFWGEYLGKQDGSRTESHQEGGQAGASMAEEFQNDPANSRYIAMFLQYILENRLGLELEQAAMFGAAVSNLAREAGELEYQKMAYGDMGEGKFRWNY